ncbi:MAG: hypothetical protein Q9187_004604 [Circinaria calcarea]
MTLILHHPILGPIKGLHIDPLLLQYRAIPYANIPRRFARSIVAHKLPNPTNNPAQPFDATKIGPSSIQPHNAVETDAKLNQLPSDGFSEQDQSEDCLTVTITVPKHVQPSARLPVLVFIHGGAFFLGSADRPYYSPLTFCSRAASTARSLVFVSMNYRLGALGFFHSSQAPDLIPANNGLHDQVRCFEWIRNNISGFGGDPKNITAIGQSAGGESLSLHNLSGQQTPLYRRSVLFSGSPVCMPSKTPDEHQENFLQQAAKLGIQVEDRSSQAIAGDMIEIDVGKIRELAFVGAPCTQSKILPYEKPTMELLRSSPPSQVSWLDSSLISSASYDGAISHNMIQSNANRKDHAKSFIKISREVLQDADRLLEIYNIREDNSDSDALLKICQFESDIGFFAASWSQAVGSAPRQRTYLQLFDLGNPFEGPLPSEKFATHTWDIVSLLGAYEDRLSADYKVVIQQWRDRVIDYIVSGKGPWVQWTADNRAALVVSNGGVSEREENEYMGNRRQKVLAFAEDEGGERGCDLLWEGVCRRFLMKGE